MEFGTKTWMKVWRVGAQLWSLRHARKKMLALPLCVLGFATLYSWSLLAKSCAFSAFLGLILFDIITLVGDLVNQFYAQFHKSSPSFSFGYVRVEILVHFTTLTSGLLINAWTFKISLELILSSPTHMPYMSQFIPALVIGAAIHFFVCLQSNPYVLVSKMSANYTYLQKCYQSICGGFGLSLKSPSDFAFSGNPFAILGVFSCCILSVLCFMPPALALTSSPRWADFLSGLVIFFAVVSTLWPLTCYTGQILLQSVPAHTLSQLEKALREALTIDGVLEFRNEMFWTLTYGKIAGCLQVRVRRDANEQLILIQVYKKLFPLVPHLTIQVTKDDVGRHLGGVQQLMRDIGSPQLMTTVINMNNSTGASSSVGSFGGGSSNSSSEMSPIVPLFGHKHVIYSTASGSSSGFSQPKRGNYNAANISTSTKINAEETYCDINETALNIGETSISSTTSSVFPVETPTLLRADHHNKSDFNVLIPKLAQ